MIVHAAAGGADRVSFKPLRSRPGRSRRSALASAASNSASLIERVQVLEQRAREAGDHAVVLGAGACRPRRAYSRPTARRPGRRACARSAAHRGPARPGSSASASPCGRPAARRAPCVSSSRRIASAPALSGLLIETSGSRIGISPCAAICVADLELLLHDRGDAGLATRRLIVERILVPKTPSFDRPRRAACRAPGSASSG